MLPRTCAADNPKILDVEIAHDSPSADWPEIVEAED